MLHEFFGSWQLASLAISLFAFPESMTGRSLGTELEIEKQVPGWLHLVLER